MGLFNFLKAAGERIKLAKTFALIYSEEKTLSSLGIDEMKSKTLDLVYVAKKGIVERMEREQMTMIHKLSIPAITGSSINTITIMQAWKLTLSRLLEISEMHGFEDEVKQILFEEQLELEKKMKSIVPGNLPKSINKKIDLLKDYFVNFESSDNVSVRDIKIFKSKLDELITDVYEKKNKWGKHKNLDLPF